MQIPMFSAAADLARPFATSLTSAPANPQFRPSPGRESTRAVGGRPAQTRREFLARGARWTLGVGAATWAGTMPLRGAPATPGQGLPRFGFTTYQWGKDWDVPTLIANLTKAKVLGTELRTSAKYAHGVELDLSEAGRREVRRRFADSPVQLVGIASGERMDWPEPEKLKAAVENAKGFLKLSHDVGSSGVRVFPNQFHPGVPREKTVEQIATALNQLGAFAADYGQEVRLEAHGAAGELSTIRSIMDRVTEPRVRVKLNSDARDLQGAGFEQNFNLVKALLGRTLHLHNLKDTKFPYQLQLDLLVKAHWDGWALLEASDQVSDRLAALVEQREIWDSLMLKAARPV